VCECVREREREREERYRVLPHKMHQHDQNKKVEPQNMDMVDQKEIVPSASDDSKSMDMESQNNKRHLTRDTLQAFGNAASNLISSSKSKSGVIKFGIETMEKLVAPATTLANRQVCVCVCVTQFIAFFFLFLLIFVCTVLEWEVYAYPLIEEIDDKLDKALDSIEKEMSRQAAERHKKEIEAMNKEAEDLNREKAAYALYLEKLRFTFVNSKWFSCVDDILRQSYIVNTVTQKLVQPAELFYNEAMELLMSTSSMEQFLEGFEQRLGSQWDDRLLPYAKAFYATSKAVQAVVGCGKFLAGTLQLGKNTISEAMDGMIGKWNKALDVTDQAVDRWLPDKPEDNTTDITHDEKKGSKSIPYPFSFQGSEKEAAAPPKKSGQSKKRMHCLLPLTQKVYKRLRQRTLPEIGTDLRAQLIDYSWFSKVDQILRQNMMVAQFAKIIRPAEHFYNTSLNVFRRNRASVENFLTSLRTSLGVAWDERLVQPAKAFWGFAKAHVT